MTLRRPNARQRECGTKAIAFAFLAAVGAFFTSTALLCMVSYMHPASPMPGLAVVFGGFTLTFGALTLAAMLGGLACAIGYFRR